MGDAVHASRSLAIVVGFWMAAAHLVRGAAAAAGGDGAYTIANYPVDATAANAVAAKDQALAEGQQSAFRSLLKRIVPVTAYKQLTRVSGIKAADLISGVAVRSERNSATDYIASLDFSFQADAVRTALSRQGIPFVDEQAPPVTVITALLQGNPPSRDERYGPLAPRLDGARPAAHDHARDHPGSEARDPRRYRQHAACG